MTSTSHSPELSPVASRTSSESIRSDSTHEHSRSISDIEETIEETCYICDVIPHKGRGLVASRSLKRGELLFTEPPLFSFPLSPPPNNSSIMIALSQCSREQQQQYFTLANSFKEKKEILPAQGIFLSNYIPYRDANSGSGEDESGERGGIFLFASYFNSSCTPNVSRYWDASKRVMMFRTLWDIEDGEELCFNYGDILGTRADRIEELSTERGFVCLCEACNVMGESIEETLAQSDERRATIARLYDEVGSCGKEPTLGLRKIKKALRLLKDEHLVHYEASFCYDAFQFCAMVSDFVNAKQWIRKAYDVSVCTSGPESESARMFRMYLANPKAHPLAGILSKGVLSGPD